jgi:hypothetical protein
MAWEGIFPALAIAGALSAANYGLKGVHWLFNEGRVRRLSNSFPQDVHLTQARRHAA